MNSLSRRAMAAVAAVFLLLPMGCGEEGAEPGSSQAFAVDDSAGVLVVRNAPLAEAPPPEWEVGSPLVDAEAGDPYGEEPFTAIDDAQLGEDGSVWGADARSPMVARMGADGEDRRVVGREGEGPGEYGDPAALLALPGDSMGVWDEALRRWTVYSAEGEAGRVEELSPGERIEGLDRTARPVGAPAPDRLLAVSWRVPPEEGDRVREEATVYALDFVEGAARPLFSEVGRERTVRADGPVVQQGPAPFGARPWVTAREDRVVYADGSRRRIDVRDAENGELLRRIDPGLPSPPVDGEAVEADEAIAEAARDGGLPNLEALLERIEAADRVPAFGPVLPGPDGELWVGEYAHASMDARRWAANARRWWVLDREGKRVARVDLPDGFILLDPGRDRVAGLRRLPDETERLTVLGLQRHPRADSGATDNAGG